MISSKQTRGRELKPHEREEILAKLAAGASHRKIAAHFGISKSTVSGIAFRARHGYQYRGNLSPGEKRKLNGSRHIRQIKPAKAPYAPDCSCPDFAKDDEHCAAVTEARRDGFPVLPVRA